VRSLRHRLRRDSIVLHVARDNPVHTQGTRLGQCLLCMSSFGSLRSKGLFTYKTWLFRSGQPRYGPQRVAALRIHARLLLTLLYHKMDISCPIVGLRDGAISRLDLLPPYGMDEDFNFNSVLGFDGRSSMYSDGDALQAWLQSVHLDTYGDEFLYASSKKPYSHPYSYPSGSFSDDELDKSETASDISEIFRNATWLTTAPLDMVDPGTDESISSCSDSSSEAQYISIPYGSPWYRAHVSPVPSLSVPSSAPPEDLTSRDFNSCSPAVQQLITQQEYLLRVFHDELRRTVPSGGGYDTDWLDDVDPEVLIAPTETFEDLCWEMSSRESSPELLRDHLVDIPRERRSLDSL